MIISQSGIDFPSGALLFIVSVTALFIVSVTAFQLQHYYIKTQEIVVCQRNVEAARHFDSGQPHF